MTVVPNPLVISATKPERVNADLYLINLEARELVQCITLVDYKSDSTKATLLYEWSEDTNIVIANGAAGNTERVQFMVNSSGSTSGAHRLFFEVGECDDPKVQQPVSVDVFIETQADATASRVVVLEEEVPVIGEMYVGQVLILALDSDGDSVEDASGFHCSFGLASCVTHVGESPGVINCDCDLPLTAEDAGNWTMTVTLNDEVVDVREIKVYCEPGEYADERNHCRTCRNGVDCETSHEYRELENLYLERGFWRQDTTAKKIRRCPNKRACQGGLGAGNELCKKGYEAPLCASCSADYVSSANEVYGCRKCSAAFVRFAIATTSCVLVVVSFVTFMLVLYRKSIEEWVGEVIGRPQLESAKVKAKIIFVLQQIVTRTSSSFPSIRWPAAFLKFTRSVEFVNVNIAALLAYGCFLPSSYYARLITMTVGATLVTVGLLFWLMIARLQKKSGTVPSTAALLFTYIVFPSVSVLVFECFSVDHNFENGRAYLRADYSVRASSSRHRHYVLYAAVMVAIWPVGVPLVYLLGLFSNRRTLNPSPEKVEERIRSMTAQHDRDTILTVADRDTILTVADSPRDALSPTDTTWVEVRPDGASPHANRVRPSLVTRVRRRHLVSEIVELWERRIELAKFQWEHSTDGVMRRPLHNYDFDGIDQARRREADALFEGVVLTLRDSPTLNADDDVEGRCAAARWSFLWRPFRPQHYLFEVVVCLWRLLLNAIVVVLLPGSSLQIVIALLIAVTMMFICAVLRPYRVDTNNDLAVLANAVLSLLLFTGLLIYLGATNSGSKRGLGLVGLIANLTCILLAFYFLSLDRFEGEPFKQLAEDAFNYVGGRDKIDKITFLLTKTSNYTRSVSVPNLARASTTRRTVAFAKTQSTQSSTSFGMDASRTTPSDADSSKSDEDVTILTPDETKSHDSGSLTNGLCP